MKHPWPNIPLYEVLTERQEIPDPYAIQAGQIRIVSKIGFNNGIIEFRPDVQTKTRMILIRPGDLVVSGINAAKGAIAIYSNKEDQLAAATIHYAAYDVNQELADRRFLWWLLRSSTFRDILDNNLPGGIKTELKAKRLLPIEIPLPPLSEQKRVLTRIEDLATRIYEAYKLKSLVVRDITLFMNSCLDQVMGELDKSGSFSDVITFKPRSGPSFVTSPDANGIPVLMPSSVTGFGVNPQKVEYSLLPVVADEKDALAPGDIIIARGNKREQVGNAGVVPAECKGWVCANLLMRLQVDRFRVDPEFCIYWLRSPLMRQHVRQKMSGTNPNIQKINQKKILEFPFPTKLPLEEQRRIVAYLASQQAKVDRLDTLQAQTAAELDALLPSILDKAFKAEL